MTEKPIMIIKHVIVFHDIIPYHYVNGCLHFRHIYFNIMIFVVTNATSLPNPKYVTLHPNDNDKENSAPNISYVTTCLRRLPQSILQCSSSIASDSKSNKW